MSAKKKESTTKRISIEELCKRYGCSRATIGRWRRKGINIHDPKAVQAYRAQKDHGGAKSKAEKEAEPNENFSFPTPTVDKKGKPEAGAAAALARLEEMEVAAYEQMDWAMKQGSPFAIKAARENWLKLGDSLRRYDAMLAEARINRQT